MDDAMLWLQMESERKQTEEIKNMNEHSRQYGLILSDAAVTILMNDRKIILKEQERVEFKGGILKKLIAEFCDSPYIWQDNYADTLGRLQEIFYLYKNESLDRIPDDELIAFMKEHFNGDCQGSADYLEDTCLEELARHIRTEGREKI